MPTTLSEATEKLIASVQAPPGEVIEPKPTAEETIGVSDITRGLGFFYEKIRNTLDYKEEALWAKNALRRALHRRFDAFLSGQPIGRNIIEELIRGRYLENNAVPESKADEVNSILAKYRRLLELLAAKYPPEESWENWLIDTAAAEIEEVVRGESVEERRYITYMYESMRSRVRIAPELQVEDLNLQLYLASFRALLQADRPMERYAVFKLIEPAWPAGEPETIERVAATLPEINRRIERVLASPLRKKLDQIFKQRSLLVFLLQDILTLYPDRARKIITDPEELETTLRDLYDKRYRENRGRLQRSAVRAVAFIFVTKMLLALLIEMPYEIFKTQGFNLTALAINTFIPPLILMGAAVAIRMPGEEKNFLKIVMDFKKLVSEIEPPPVLDSVRPERRRSFFVKLWLAVLYVLNFAATFGLLFWILKILRFNWLSGGLFVFFLCLVAFFALRLRKTANELAAIGEKEGALSAALEFLFFPIVEIGRVLARGLASINIASFIFDFFVEAPFQAFVAILEEWLTFMGERRKAL